MRKPLILTILDGFGIAPQGKGNAVNPKTVPNIKKLFAKYPVTKIGASGMDVGLPDGQMGNSEVGHTNIGAGRVVYQELTRITKSIKDGDFFRPGTNYYYTVNITSIEGKNVFFDVKSYLSYQSFWTNVILPPYVETRRKALQ